MAKEAATTAEQDKGHTVYRVLLATAKKKHMDALNNTLGSLEKSGKVTILARDQVSKTKLLRQYEQLRVFYGAPEESLDLNEDIVAHMDYFTISETSPISLKASTFKELDTWLKWNIKEHTAQFQVRGGVLDVREEKERQANGAVLRTCHYSLKGELRLVMQYRDRMLEQKLADPKTFEYQFWDPVAKKS